MAVIELVILFSALSCVEPSALFALEAKPLELTILGDEYCEYGLSRRRPYKWCICWGKIATRVEVLPWDCTTRAPIGLRRRRTRNSNSKMGNLWRDLYTKGNFFPPLTSKSLGIPAPQVKLDPLLEKAYTLMFKEIAESKSGDSLLAEELRLLLVPYLRSYVDPLYRKPSLVSRVSPALKLLLLELDKLYMIELEHSLFKSEWPHLKNLIIAALEELSVILKGPPDNSREIVSEGPYWEYDKYEPATEDGQIRESMTQARSTSVVPDEKVSSVSEGAGMDMWKAWASGDYSNLSKMLGTKNTVSKVVGNSSQFVKAILNNALAAQIAQIFDPAGESNAGLLFAGLGASPNSSDNNAMGARIAQILFPDAESSSKRSFAGLGVSPSSSKEGMKNKIEKEYSYTPVGLDDKTLSNQAGLDRKRLTISKIGNILIPRRPNLDLVDRSTALINKPTGFQQSANSADISIFKTENSPHDPGYSPDMKRDDSVLGGSATLSSGDENGNSLTLKANESSSQREYFNTEILGNHTHTFLISPEPTERGDSSLGKLSLGKSTLGDSSFGKSSLGDSTLSDSTDGMYPEKREDHITQKRMNSSELTGKNYSACNSVAQSEASKFGTSSYSKQMYSNREEPEGQTETLMNLSKLTNPADSTLEDISSPSKLLKLENGTTSNLKFNKSTPTSEKLYDQTPTTDLNILRYWE